MEKLINKLQLDEEGKKILYAHKVEWQHVCKLNKWRHPLMLQDFDSDSHIKFGQVVGRTEELMHEVKKKRKNAVKNLSKRKLSLLRERLERVSSSVSSKRQQDIIHLERNNKYDTAIKMFSSSSYHN